MDLIKVAEEAFATGKVVNIPSFAVKPGMVGAVREKSKSLEVIEAALAVITS